MKKKLGAILLVLCLVFSVFPPFAWADGGYTEDAEGNVAISTAEGLRQLAAAVNGGNSFTGKTVTLTADLDLKNEPWTPIGREEAPFMGTFDGGGHTVSNLTVSDESMAYAGLFGLLKSPGAIQDLTVNNVTITAQEIAGGLIGSAFTGSVTNCHVTGAITVSAHYKAGGLAGEGYANLENCTVKGSDGSEVTATHDGGSLEGDNVGGLIGFKGEGGNRIENCLVENLTVTGTRKIGGLVGSAFLNNQITGCEVRSCTVQTNATEEYASANSATMGVGGLVGLYTANGNNDGALEDCSVENITLQSGSEAVRELSIFRYVVAGARPLNESQEALQNIMQNNLAMGSNTGSNAGEEGSDFDGVPAAVRIGDRYYASLSSAFDNAVDGDTITLLRSMEGPGVTVLGDGNRTLTFDLNGYTYTLDTEPTEASGFQLLEGSTITFRNGTIKVGKENDLFNVILSSCDLTLENMTIDGREPEWCLYLLSVDCGNVILKGNTNLYAREGRSVFNLTYDQTESGDAEETTVTIDESMTGTLRGEIQFAEYETSGSDWQSKIKLIIRNGYFDIMFSFVSPDPLEDLVANANIEISGGYFNFDPTFYLMEGKVAVASDQENYLYMVTESRQTEVPVIPTQGETTVKVEDLPEDLSEDEKKSLTGTAETVSISGLTAHAGSVAAEIGPDEAKDAVEELNQAIADEEIAEEDVTLFVEAYLDVQPTGYDSQEKTLSLDITPMYRVIATTAKDKEDVVLEQDGEDAVNAIVSQENELKVQSPVVVTLYLPLGFADGSDVFVEHNKGGKTYVYAGEFVKSKLTFVNPHGFSEFVVTLKNNAKASVDSVGYLSLADAIDDVEDEGTVTLLQDGLSATVSRSVSFRVNGGDNGYTANLRAGSGYKMSYDKETGLYTFTRKSSSSSSGEKDPGAALPYAPGAGPGMAPVAATYRSDTTYDLTVDGMYQFRITSLDGTVPVMTVDNSNFRVELASQEGGDYFFKLYAQSPSGAKSAVSVNGGYLLTATAA